ncbi:MAG: ISAs1 family transposase [Flavisolibacter sp.]|nr:ISAs1 family transposase [Flavisolibacter sp.]
MHYVLLFSIFALLCNATSYRDIRRFISVHFAVLKEHFGLRWKKAPAFTTVRYIIQGVHPEELEAAFRGFTQSMVQYNSSETLLAIAVDGKTLRGSADHFCESEALHKLMFFDTEQHLILGHVEVGEKTNEIPLVQALLKELELQNALFTLDAMPCQKKTFQAAGETHGLLVQIKENQQELLKDVRCMARSARPTDSYPAPLCCGHGRLEKRTTAVYGGRLCEELLDEQWAALLKTIVCVHRCFEVWESKTKQYRHWEERSYYLSNRTLSAPAAHHLVQGHWSIENKNHHVRAVTLLEDQSRIGKNPFNVSVLRSFALNVLRKNKVHNIRAELFENSLNWQRIYRYPQAC